MAKEQKSAWQNIESVLRAMDKNRAVLLVVLLGVSFLSMFLTWLDVGLATVNGWGYVSELGFSEYALISIPALLLLTVPVVFALFKKNFSKFIKFLCVCAAFLLAVAYTFNFGQILFILCAATSAVIIFREDENQINSASENEIEPQER